MSALGWGRGQGSRILEPAALDEEHLGEAGLGEDRLAKNV
jgi:hypothetical protein